MLNRAIEELQFRPFHPHLPKQFRDGNVQGDDQLLHTVESNPSLLSQHMLGDLSTEYALGSIHDNGSEESRSAYLDKLTSSEYPRSERERHSIGLMSSIRDNCVSPDLPSSRHHTARFDTDNGASRESARSSDAVDQEQAMDIYEDDSE
jgi:hypothetical protein